jgi:predicted AlkP superfamily pyrophosphatase or phosphodiesterase
MAKKAAVFVSLFLMLCFGMGMLTLQSGTASEKSDDPAGQARKIENPYVEVPSAIQNMYHPTRFPSIYLITQPNCLFTDKATYEKIQNGEKPGTVASHGSVWNYDTDVPIIFYGKGIKKGYLGGEANLIDIAPTLAYLAGVQRPAAAKGRILNEIIEPEAATWNSEERPKVLVLFSLDQGRSDYLNVFEDAFAFLKGQVIKNGATFAQSRICYAKTATAVSHTAVGTGTIPGIHGILGNNVLQADGSFPLSVDDGNATDYGHGDLSPHNILVPTLADELDRRYNNRSVVISSSSYARAAVGVAGHGAYYKDGDYAYSGADKDIVFACNRYSGLPYTNTDFYTLPDYFDAKNNPDIHIKNWLKKYYGLDIESTPWSHDLTVMDNGPYSASQSPVGHASASFPWGETYTFSYPLATTAEAEPYMLQRYQDYNKDTTVLSKRYYNASTSPFLDLWNADLNLMAMEKEKVGQDNVPDFVFFHLKSMDVVGHSYGVYSGEIYNYMFFGDYIIKKVTQWLDRNVGEGNYTCVFFGDHGGNNVAVNGQWIVKEDMKEAMEARFGSGILSQFAEDQIWINPKNGVSYEEVASWMEENFDWVVQAYSAKEVVGQTGAELTSAVQPVSVNGGYMVTPELWLKAVIHTQEKGMVNAVWKQGGQDVTSTGDTAVWGYFYANPSDVEWGRQNNAEMVVKVWFDHSGRVDVNYSHVSLPNIEVYADYKYDGTPDIQGTASTSKRYIRQYFENGKAYTE